MVFLGGLTPLAFVVLLIVGAAAAAAAPKESAAEQRSAREGQKQVNRAEGASLKNIRDKRGKGTALGSSEEEEDPFYAARGRRGHNEEEEVPFWAARGRRVQAEEELPFWAARGRRNPPDEEVPFWAARGRRVQAEEEVPFWAARGRRDPPDEEAPFWAARGRRDHPEDEKSMTEPGYPRLQWVFPPKRSVGSSEEEEIPFWAARGRRCCNHLKGTQDLKRGQGKDRMRAMVAKMISSNGGTEAEDGPTAANEDEDVFWAVRGKRRRTKEEEAAIKGPPRG